MPTQRLQTYPVICQGGLNSNQNWLQLSAESPGVAVTLVNFEPSLFGGYRRVSGFLPLEGTAEEVDEAGAEGPILGVFIYNDSEILTARKQKNSDNYEFYQWNPGNAWTKLTTGLTRSATGVTRIRYQNYNFNGTPSMIFTDGVNKALIYDGTNWTEISSSNSGATPADAGGPMALDQPKYVTLFKNHIFLSGDATAPNVVAHSSPNSDYDWTSGNGGGQLPAGFDVVQICPFRDSNYVFGFTNIKKIDVNGTTFVLNDVTTNLGCIASDSVVEINGDLLFLSQDGFRPISGTMRLQDVELGSVSKSIQQDVIDLIRLYNNDAVTSVVVRRKSQVRFFFATQSTVEDTAPGVIGGLKLYGNGVGWEWANLRGIKVACCTSGYIGEDEFVLHGSYDGKVYRQEQGGSFNGQNIYAVYATPYIDFGDPLIRKTIQQVTLFARPEGPVTISTNLRFDWNRNDVYNPGTFTLQSQGDLSIYGEAVYGVNTYGGSTVPVMVTNTHGSGFSAQLVFHTDDTSLPYTIQGIVYEYEVNGRK